MNGKLRGCTVLGLAGAVLLSACSANLGPETLPSTTPATEPSETVPEETEVTLETTVETTVETEPLSEAVITGSIVEEYGRLEIDGTEIVNSDGDAVILKGISSFNIVECDEFFTAEIVKTLAEDWGCDVLRIAVTGDEDNEGYFNDPEGYFNTVCKVCNMCIDQGIYVIVDWDVMYTDDYDDNEDEAVSFFKRLSTIYPDSDNIIYEVNNYAVPGEADAEDDEDTDEDEWDDIIVPFATGVIDAVRENNPDSIIIVGAPEHGLGVDTASDSMLDYDNICYGCRIFSGTNKQEQRDRISEAIDNDACVFITEWSYCTEYLKGGIFTSETDNWSNFFDENGISWCNYAIGSDVENDTNALQMHSDKYTFEQIYAGHWPDGLISRSGLYARELLLKTAVEAEDTDADDGSDDEE